MDDLAARVKALEERATQRTQNTQHTQQTQRERQWQAVQEQSPETADFMLAINKTFGKPASVKVTLNSGEVILDSGAV
jgi:hypothetical protein